MDSLIEKANVMIRGSLVKQKATCGKPNCVCTREPARRHIRYFLSYSDKGKTRMVYIAKRKVPELSEALEAWRAFKERSKELASANLRDFLREKKK